MIKIYFLSRRGLQQFYTLIEASFVGFWLGILKKETLHALDKHYYTHSQMYYDEGYNRQGFWSWEQRVLENYFQQRRCLLVAGVGGGREVLALYRLGYEVAGFECHPQLVKCANELLEKEGFTPNIQFVPRDQCPDGVKLYDGLIVGWGAYMLIQGQQQRIAFLRKLRAQTREQAPLLLSFFHRFGTGRRFKLIATIGNVVRWMFRRDRLEVGDDLVPNYVHYFAREEIAAELEAGGFKLELYDTHGYGHAVGIAAKQTGGQFDNGEPGNTDLQRYADGINPLKVEDKEDCSEILFDREACLN